MKKSTKKPLSVYEFDEETLLEALILLLTEIGINSKETEFFVYPTENFEKTVRESFIGLVDSFLSLYPDNCKELTNQIKSFAEQKNAESYKYKIGTGESKSYVSASVHFLYDLFIFYYEEFIE